MRRKVFSLIVAIIFAFAFWGCASTDIASDGSQTVVSDPQALVERWEGSARGLDSNWSSYFALEIFAVDLNRKRVIYRGFCPDCRTSTQWYNDNTPLTVEGGKVFFESFPNQTTGWSGIKYELKGNRISGFARSQTEAGTWRFDYSLKRVSEVKKVFEPKELLGEWIWASGSRWRELIVEEVDTQNKTFKGKYKIDTGKEYPLIEAKIVSFGNVLKIDFWTTNRTTHYQLTYYPNFREYPPVLWGQFERLTGESNYKMFRKKEKKD